MTAVTEARTCSFLIFLSSFQESKKQVGGGGRGRIIEYYRNINRIWVYKKENVNKDIGDIFPFCIWSCSQLLYSSLHPLNFYSAPSISLLL